MTLRLKDKAVSYLEGYSVDHVLVEIRKHELIAPKKNVVTLVFRFERYEK